MQWNFFISHAHEDKDEIARPIADLLKSQGFTVWFDEYSLKLGDELRSSIEKGLRGSRFGVVILSPNFFAKKWTRLELDGLFQLDGKDEKRILPVWHGVTAADVEAYSLFLANRLGVPTSKGFNHVVTKIIEATQKDDEDELNYDDPEPSIVLHPRSIEMLEAAKNSNGSITAHRHLAGFLVRSGDVIFGQDNNPRIGALNSHCLEELVSNGLAEKRSETLYVLNQDGYDFVPKSVPSDAPRYPLPALKPSNQELGEKIMQGAVAGDGCIRSFPSLANHQFQVGGMFTENSRGDRRPEAQWKTVLNELREKGLLSQASVNLYRVSHLGYIWTDTLNLRNSTDGSAAAKGSI